MKLNNIKLNRNFLLIINIFLLIVIIILIYIITRIPSIKFKNFITRDSNSPYVLTNPILDCEADIMNDNTVVFSDNVIKKVNELKNNFGLSHVSLYFRDLNNGPWVGVQEKEVFSPASLLKVPILIALLHQAEKDPSILNKKITISNSDFDTTYNQNLKPLNPLVLNNEYTLSKIAEDMIEKSDNIAVMALLANINPTYISDVFKSVGVPYKDINTEVNVRVKDYAGFFRVLYNSSYLNREMSEKALEILSKSEFKDGLVAGVPEGINVAHKFGERSVNGVKGEIQIHDCGIIYYPNKPYILCIMTRGDSIVDQENTIKSLSSYIYNEVIKNKTEDL